MKNKKGQHKIQQMAFMLIALFIFMILAAMFFLWLYLNDAGKKADVIEEEMAILAAQFISKTPEFGCGDNCIDTDQIMLLRNRSFYKNFWDFKSLEVRRIYPAGKLRECNSVIYPNCDFYKIYDTGESTKKLSSFIALCRKEDYKGIKMRRCELGKVIVGIK